MSRLFRVLSCLLVAASALIVPGVWADGFSQDAKPAEIAIGYIGAPERDLTLSLLDLPAEDDGVAGAELAIADNNTTGQFTKQSFSLKPATAANPDELKAAIDAYAASGTGFIVADLPAPLLLAAADMARERGMVLFNVSAPDDILRQAECRANVIHVAPSRAMLADALAQYLVWKKWARWFLLTGSHEEDKLFAEALKRAAGRFGGTVVEERVYQDTGGARRTDSGHVQVQRQMPVFTQSAPEHDVILVADESEVFGSYVPYRTWDARPVAGSAGLRATSWSPAHEQWGALQLQSRFGKSAQRLMTDKDYNAWTAVRMIGEAATRTQSSEVGKIAAFLRDPAFELAAFKGQKVTVRDWDLQLRQPVLLADGRTVVSVSPQEGFLHQVSELDTLGTDKPESQCRLDG